jgi:opacity protein-like surface antigen
MRSAFLILLVAAAARADEPCSGKHCHDGFYLRFGAGLAAYDESVNASSGNHDPDARVVGLASVNELGIGWAIQPGRILGIGAWDARVLVSDRAVRSGVDPSLAAGIGRIALIGVFTDWYPDPTGGFHFQGGLGFAIGRSVRATTGEIDHRAYGGGLMLGLGYERWVTDNWAIGALARVSGALTTDKDASGTRYTHATGVAPAILLTATFN